MAVRWFVDGLEVDQARGASRYELHADGGPHEVRVSIEDCSGSIRAPDAREHVGGVAWIVRNEPEAPGAQGAASVAADRRVDPDARRPDRA